MENTSVILSIIASILAIIASIIAISRGKTKHSNQSEVYEKDSNPKAGRLAKNIASVIAVIVIIAVSSQIPSMVFPTNEKGGIPRTPKVDLFILFWAVGTAIIAKIIVNKINN